MGTVTVTQTAPSSGRYATATISWDSSFNVTVQTSGTAGWAICKRGQSQPKLVTGGANGSGTFSASNNTDYVFQVYCTVEESFYNDGNGVFTVTDDSSSGGGGIVVGQDNYLYITQGDGTALTVELYTSYGFQKVQSGFLISAGATQYFRILCTALPGYELDKYEHLDGTGSPITTIGFTYTNLTATTKTIDGEEYVLYFALGGYGDPTITSSASPKAYTLSLLKDIGSSIAVTRISSKQSDAVIGAELADGDTIYHFDELQVNFEADTGYDCSVSTASGQVLSDGDIIQVSDDVSIVSEATVKQYTLTLEPSTGSTITVRRTSSPLQNATIGIINNNETIYHSDVLEITLSSSPEYKIVNQYVNQEAFASGDTFEVTEDITVKTVTELHGIAYIYDGTSFGQHLIHIFHNGEWAQYISYVYQDSTWNICS